MTNYTINHTEYWIEEFDKGFAWNNNLDEGDTNSPFRATHLEALQDAINWESGRRDRHVEADEAEEQIIRERRHNESLRGPL